VADPLKFASFWLPWVQFLPEIVLHGLNFVDCDQGGFSFLFSFEME
jgi:hypothetical protein